MATTPWQHELGRGLMVGGLADDTRSGRSRACGTPSLSSCTSALLPFQESKMPQFQQEFPLEGNPLLEKVCRHEEADTLMSCVSCLPCGD